MKTFFCFIALMSLVMLSSDLLYSSNPIPADATAYAGPDDNVCEGSSYDIMLSTASNYASLWWTSSGSGTFNDASLLHPTYYPGVGEIGPVTLTLTAYAIVPGANASDDMILTIHDGPEADFTMSPNDTAYINEVVTFTGMSTSTITSWNWDFGDGSTATGQVVNYTYFFSGAYDISLIVTNIDGCQDTVIYNLIVVDPIIDFIMSPNPSCVDYLVSFTGIGGIGPGDYEWDFGDGNTATGQNVSHTYTQIGLFTVELTFGPDQIQHNLDVMDASFAYAGPDDSICSNESCFLSLAFAYNNTAVNWLSSGDGSFDDPTMEHPTYYPGPGDISSGTAVLTLTAYAIAPCGNATDSMTLIIDPGPVVNAGSDTSSCEGSPLMLNGYASGQTSNTWTTAGDGTFDDPNLLNASYTAGVNDMINGSVVLTLTAFATLPCVTNESDDLLLNFPLQPTADAGSDDMTCGIEAYTLAGSATNYSSIVWTSSGDGNFDDPSLLDATYTPGSGDITNGSASLTITALANQPCTDSIDEMLLSILTSPTANAGDDDGICQGETYTLAGTASDYNEISWNTNGDGSFDDPTIFDPTYTPGPTDIVNREATLTLTATPIAPCTLGMIDAMQLGVDPMVGNPTTPVGPTTVDSYLNPTSEYEIDTTPEANGYKWSLSPSTAGDVDGTDITGLVTWNASFHGFAYVRVAAYNSCTEITSDSLEIEVTTSVGFADHHLKELEVKIMPNPSKGIFKVEIKGIQQKLGLIIYDSYGSIVKETSIRTIGHHEQSFDLSHLPKGMYILKLYGTNVIQKEKIVIR